MPSFLSGLHRSSPTALALLLAIGWAGREWAHARDSDPAAVTSRTINLDDVPMKPYSYEGKTVGKIGIYAAGESARSRDLVIGRLVLNPGESPHPPHVHPEEEVMVIEAGHGEIFVDGKTTPIGPGSVMFTEPEVSHGIRNTGTEPIIFTFLKWAPKK